jgi:hypothetical protein
MIINKLKFDYMKKISKKQKGNDANTLLATGWFDINDRTKPIKPNDDFLIRLEDGQIKRYNEDWEDERLLVTHWKPF